MKILSFLRLFPLFWLLASLFVLGGMRCVPPGEPGDPCPLSQEASKIQLDTGDARILEPSFDCSLPYCLATTSAPETANSTGSKGQKKQGYCSKICEDDADCPRGFTCAPAIELNELPPEYNNFRHLIGKRLCFKTGSPS
jgi:hypothetical protein